MRGSKIIRGSKEFNRLQGDMKARDAVISFLCSSPNIVHVSEIIDGESRHHHSDQQFPDVVSEVEERYMFFAKQADIAREQIKLGHSCRFNVYFREP